MKKEIDYRDDELIDLGAVTEETHGSNDGFDTDGLQKRIVLGFLVD